MRGFGIRNRYLIYLLTALFLGPLFVLQKLNLFNSLTKNRLVGLLKKNPQTPPLGLETEYFKKNFESLSKQERQIWLDRLKKYYKKDKLREHIYFKSDIENIIKKGKYGR